MKSRSVKRKSPTSAWRRSTSSTRRTRARFGAWYTKPVAVAAAEAAVASEAAEAAELALAAEAAEAAEAVEAAEAAELAGELAWELPAEAAARRGELAAGARADRFPIALTNAGPYGRVRQKRPGQSMSCLRCPRGRSL
jgi:hypothetical protein